MRPTTISAPLLTLALFACDAAPTHDEPLAIASTPDPARPALGLMTSLPIYWSLDASMEQIASGNGAVPWQRTLLETRYDLVPLDTLSLMPGISPEAPEVNPLADLERLAVIQPRGLSPADNVALDEWVAEGGQLLLVLDPMLSGHYELPLGDPRLPTQAAIIPPVVERWGLEITYDDDHSHGVEAAQLEGDGEDRSVILRSMSGKISPSDSAKPDCEYRAERMIARCRVGDGQVTLVADAASFEYSLDEFVERPSTVPPILALGQFAFGEGPNGDFSGRDREAGTR